MQPPGEGETFGPLRGVDGRTGDNGLNDLKAMETILRALPWDSQHFGLPVAEIVDPDLADDELDKVLQCTKERRVALVYWATRPDRAVPAWLIGRYAGTLVDWKTTFAADVSLLLKNAEGAMQSGVRAEEFIPKTAPQQLIDLGISAGVHSRFRIDPRIPWKSAEDLYAIWTQGSVSRALADVVYVVREAQGATEARFLGFVTASAKREGGSIGLIAVHRDAQGNGLGRVLIRAVHEWFAGRGITRAQVVTQRENRAACKLYERAGYCVRDVRQFYHFWPLCAEPE